MRLQSNNVKTCAHPNCSEQLKRGRMTCGRHWYALTDYLRARSKEVQKTSAAATDALKVEMVSHFRRHLIGDHEVLGCRGSTCHANIVWLPTRKGKNMAVEVILEDTGDWSGLAAADTVFRYDQHTAHWGNCPDAAEFRKR